MNINNFNKFLPYNLTSPSILSTSRKTTRVSNSPDKMSAQYRNRYADVNEVKVNSQGLTGMLFNFDTVDTSSHKQIIEISDEGRQKIFDMVKSEFIKENGVHNGDTTKRTQVYVEYLKGIPEKDRAKASFTLDRIEAEYWGGFVAAVKKSNPKWEAGMPFDSSITQNITRADLSDIVDKHSNKRVDICV